MLFRLIILLILPIAIFAEEPWGSDADFSNPRPDKKKPALIAGVLIKFHQQVISPIDGPRSHFSPSSSAYAYEAMARYGFLKGFTMACDRLMRENRDPWKYTLYQTGGYTHKWDPPVLYTE